MIASQPPLMHTTSCKGESELKAARRVTVERDLEVSQWSTSHYVMGQRPIRLPAGDKSSTTEVTKDGRRYLFSNEEVHKHRQGGENLTGLVRGEASHGLTKVTGLEARGSRCRTIQEGLVDNSLKRSSQIEGLGWRPEWEGALWMFVLYLLDDLRRGQGQVLKGESLDDIAVLTVIYSQLGSPGIAASLRGTRCGRFTVPGERLAISPSL